MRITGLSKTDSINRAVQVYASSPSWLVADGREVLLRDENGDTAGVHIV